MLENIKWLIQHMLENEDYDVDEDVKNILTVTDTDTNICINIKLEEING